jgi:hypothetical protein
LFTAIKGNCIQPGDLVIGDDVVVLLLAAWIQAQRRCPLPTG